MFLAEDYLLLWRSFNSLVKWNPPSLNFRQTKMIHQLTVGIETKKWLRVSSILQMVGLSQDFQKRGEPAASMSWFHLRLKLDRTEKAGKTTSRNCSLSSCRAKLRKGIWQIWCVGRKAGRRFCPCRLELWNQVGLTVIYSRIPVLPQKKMSEKHSCLLLCQCHGPILAYPTIKKAFNSVSYLLNTVY